MGYVLGVDLGTTYTAAAVGIDGDVDVFDLGDRAPAIPSVVLLRSDDEVLVGEAAERRGLSESSRLAREFKRRLGDPVPLLLGGTPYGAEALTGHLLRAVVQRVTERQGSAPDLIVLSHPANYGEYKKDLLAEAVRQADIGSVSYLTEPQAAAVHYARLERMAPGEIVAVYDLGGGTFDAAVLSKTEQGFDLLGTPEGMDRLGGIDFDHAVFGHVETVLGGKIGELDPTDAAAMSALARLREECRDAKEALSADTDATIPVLLPNVQTEVRLTRPEFEAVIRPRIVETIATLERAVRSAGISMDDVSRILLVGGSSRIPLVAPMIREATGRPVSADTHPKFAIAMGAALAGMVELGMVPGETGSPVTAAGVVESAPTVAAATAAASATDAPPAPEPTPDATKRKLPMVVAAAALLVVVLAVGAFAMTQQKRKGTISLTSGSSVKADGDSSSAEEAAAEEAGTEADGEAAVPGEADPGEAPGATTAGAPATAAGGTAGSSTRPSGSPSVAGSTGSASSPAGGSSTAPDSGSGGTSAGPASSGGDAPAPASPAPSGGSSATTSPPATTPAPAAAVRPIVFTRDGNIHRINPDGSGPAQLTTATQGGGDGPSQSPDGTKVAFARGCAGCTDVWIMNIDGSGQTRLTDGTAHAGQPDWSPDGKTIAYYRGGDIRTIPATGGTSTVRTSGTPTDENPDWSPDGTRIAFNRQGVGPQLLVLSTNAVTAVFTGGGTFGDPAWTPDGNVLAIAGTKNGVTGLWTVPVGGSSNPINIATGTLSKPQWSSDGGRLVASLVVGSGKADLRVMNADGSGATSISTGANSYDPDWR